MARKRRVITMEVIHEIAKSKGLVCLSQNYIHNAQKLLWRCHRGHEFRTRYTSIERSNYSGCRECNMERQMGESIENRINRLKSIAEDNGGKLLSTEKDYRGAHYHLLFECREGHQWNSSPSNIMEGRWCRICQNRIAASKKRIDLSGLVSGNLAVLYRDEIYYKLRSHLKYKVSRWICRCKICGKEVSIAQSQLTNGNALCCPACAHKRVARSKKTHGMSGSKLYKRWAGLVRSAKMKNIPFEPDWKNNLLTFLEDTGLDEEKQIRRIDPNEGYTRNNCIAMNINDQVSIIFSNTSPIKYGFTTLIGRIMKGNITDYYLLRCDCGKIFKVKMLCTMIIHSCRKCKYAKIEAYWKKEVRLGYAECYSDEHNKVIYRVVNI